MGGLPGTASASTRYLHSACRAKVAGRRVVTPQSPLPRCNDGNDHCLNEVTGRLRCARAGRFDACMLRALTSVLLAASAAFVPRAELAVPADRAEPASVQSCTTQCQSTFTDCVLACDGDVGCERRCQAEVTRCVEVCRKPVAPAPPGASSVADATATPHTLFDGAAGGVHLSAPRDQRALAGERFQKAAS